MESTTFAVDAMRGRDPDYPLEAMLAAEGPRGSTCFFLTRQEAPQDGYPERYAPELERAIERTRAAGVEVGSLGQHLERPTSATRARPRPVRRERELDHRTCVAIDLDRR